MKSRLLFFTMVMLLVITCRKEEEIRIPVIKVEQFKFDTSTAVFSCKVEDDGGSLILGEGICWSTETQPTIEEDNIIQSAVSNSFTGKIENLIPGTQYFVKAFATNSIGTGYSGTSVFKTLGDKPVLNSVSCISFLDSAKISFKVNPKGLKTDIKIDYGEDLTYGKTEFYPLNPVYGNEEILLTTSIKGLKCGTNYHFRVSVSNQKGSIYSTDQTFKTRGELPRIYDTYPDYSRYFDTIVISADVYSYESSPTVIYEYGQTTDYGEMVTAINNEAIFSDLLPGMTYHWRIKATNCAGTVTGIDHVLNVDTYVPYISVHIKEKGTNFALTECYIQTYGFSSKVDFAWGATTDYGNAISLDFDSQKNLDFFRTNINIPGLSPGKLYYYSATVTTKYGTRVYTGNFYTEGQIPMVWDLSTVFLDLDKNTLLGYVNPCYLPTKVTFEWGITASFETSKNTFEFPEILTGNSKIPVSIQVSSLLPDGYYVFRIKAENEVGIAYPSFYFHTYSAKDADGNFYHSVKIGTQTWLKENLKTTRYNNGDLIGTTEPGTKDISVETTPKYQWAPEGIEGNVPVYGRLYTWHAITDSRKICPTGWHVPTDAEFNTLAEFFGGKVEAGGKLKETGTIHWHAPNTGAQNSYDFTALPSGDRTSTGYFGGVGALCNFWTSTAFDAAVAWKWLLLDFSTWFTNDKIDKNFAAGVRCIKD